MNQGQRYLLDTDICVYLLNGNERIKERIAVVGLDSIAVSMLSLGELYFGAYNSQQVANNVTRIRTFFTPPGPPLISLDLRAMEYFGRFKATLRKTGHIIGDMDLLIASVAVSRSLIVVTNNTRHFDRVPELKVENWHEQ